MDIEYIRQALALSRVTIVSIVKSNGARQIIPTASVERYAARGWRFSSFRKYGTLGYLDLRRPA